MMGEFGWFGPGLGGLFMILVWVLAIAGIVAIIKWLGSTAPRRSGTARETLKARYALGDIKKKECERMRRELQE